MSCSLAAFALVALAAGAAGDASSVAARQGSSQIRGPSTTPPSILARSRTASSPRWPYVSPADTTPPDSSSAGGGEEGVAAPDTPPDSGLSPEAVAAMKAALGIRGSGGAGADTLPRTVEALQEAGPVNVPYDESPALVRDRELRRLLEEHLVPVIEEQALSVRTGTRFWVLVDSRGTVADAVIQTSSGHSAFDRAATQVAVNLRYEPAAYRGQPTPVWVLVRVSLLMP